VRRTAAVLAAALLLAVGGAARPAGAAGHDAAVGLPAAAAGGHPRRALWVETSANLRALASRQAIRALVARARAAGVDTLVPEAKNAWGYVIYESAFAPHIRTSPLPRPAYPAPREWFPQEHDPLAVLIDEAHAAGLRVHAAVNAFGEGLALGAGTPTVGLVHERPAWESLHLRAGPAGEPVFVPSTRALTIAFANAAHPEVVLYELAVLWEVLARYPVDGIVLDRARFAGPDADFSAVSRARFEAFLGRPVARWPDDVARPEGEGLRPGPLFRQWIAWRAGVITAYVRAARQLARQMRPGLPVGMYVGAWYPTIYELGQNWARPEAPRLFRAWSPQWAQASLVPFLDYVMVGLYYRPITPAEVVQQGGVWWRSVAGGAVLARQLLGPTPVLGSLWLNLYRADRARGEAAIRAAWRYTDGLMVFDLSDVEAGDWWLALGLR
jgi:uncharacterized lipoprotein YddW (UPF0748 family)